MLSWEGGNGYQASAQQEPDNRYRYNGKEVIEDVGLIDYGARWYDPAIGRWNATDPLAKKYATYSTYAYTLNNPISYINPNGMEVFQYANGYTSTGMDAQNAFRDLQNSYNGIPDPGKTNERYDRKITYDLDESGYNHGIHETQVWTISSLNESGDILSVKTVTKQSAVVVDEYGNIAKSWIATDEAETFYTVSYITDPGGGTFPAKKETGRISSSSLQENASLNEFSKESRLEAQGLQAAVQKYGNRWSPYSGNANLALRSGAYSIFVSAVTKAPVPVKVGFSAGLILGNYYRATGNHHGRSSTILSEVKTKSY